MGAGIAKALGSLALVYADDAPDVRPEGALDYEKLVAAAAPIRDVEAAETELAGIFYTGGTTGRSRGSC
jgi:long-chain acyl-CoA synthetase